MAIVWSLSGAIDLGEHVSLDGRVNRERQPARQPRSEWWQTAVVYQIYPRSFNDTTANGVGDLQGITDRLSYLSDTLGVDAIWISPFYPSPMVDFGYDVADYCDVDPLFGDLATFEELVGSAHEAGLKVLIDFVPNHSSIEHPWFVESRRSRDDIRRNWYIWRDPKPDGSPPNNWLSVFGGSAWEFDPQTQQYYLHTFLREQPDLNWRNPDVQAAMLGNMRFWLDLGVDGFRVDAVPFLMKDPAMRDNPLAFSETLAGHKDMGEYDTQRHVYDREHPDLHGLLRDMRAVLDEYQPPRMALAELHVFDADELASFYGRELDELHMPSNFGLMKAVWSAAGVRGVVDAIEAAVPNGAWPNYVLGTHDDRRMMTRLGEHGSRQAAVLLLTLRGSPTLYYGDELGMSEVEIEPSQQLDPWADNAPGLGRDGCRTPMQWSPDPGAGFTSANESWLPIGPDSAVRNVRTQLADPDSHLNLYRRLLSLRRGSTVLRRGSYVAVDGVPEYCFVFERAHGDEHAVIAVNFSDDSVDVELPGYVGSVAVSTYFEKDGWDVADTVNLLPYEAVVLM